MTSAALMLLTTAAIMRSSSFVRCSCIMPGEDRGRTGAERKNNGQGGECCQQGKGTRRPQQFPTIRVDNGVPTENQFCVWALGVYIQHSRPHCSHHALIELRGCSCIMPGKEGGAWGGWATAAGRRWVKGGCQRWPAPPMIPKKMGE